MTSLIVFPLETPQQSFVYIRNLQVTKNYFINYKWIKDFLKMSDSANDLGESHFHTYHQDSIEKSLISSISLFVQMF